MNPGNGLCTLFAVCEMLDPARTRDRRARDLKRARDLRVRQLAIVRARLETDYQALQVIIEYINVKQGGLLATVERKRKLMIGALEDRREKLSKKIRSRR